MQRNINLSTISLNSYLEKQKRFIILVRSIQYSLNNKEYKQYNYSIDEFIRMRWNISKAQAYRYLICAKVIDQLEEFEILPCFERICRALYNCAKTKKQMKLLWSSILNSAGNRPDSINSSHVKKIWKKLCDDKKYSNICHYEDEIINKVEKSLKHSKENKNGSSSENESESESISQKEKDQLNQSSLFSSNIIVNNNVPQYVFYPSPIINESTIPSNYVYNNFVSPQSSYESFVSLNDNIQYSNISSPLSVCSSNLYEENNTNQLNINNSISAPIVNVIEYPVIDIPCSTKIIDIENSKLFSNYQPQPQPQPQSQSQPNLFYY